MATGQTTTGDISYTVGLYAIAEMLYRATPYLVFEKFGQVYVLPNNSSKTARFSQYISLDAAPVELVEGTTPDATKLEKRVVDAVLKQYGARIELSDIILDTHEDPTLREGVAVLGEQAAEMIENMRFGILKAGSSVMYADGADFDGGRSTVVGPLTLKLQRAITRKLKANKARMITTIVKSTPSYETKNVPASYVAICHPNCEADIRDMDHFKSVEDYGKMSPWENEIGAVEGVRYIYSTIITPWTDAGGDPSTNSIESDGGTAANVYPILYIAKNAYGIVPLKGQNSLTPLVVNPKPSDSDPLGQRGHIGWKAMQTCVILNDDFMYRAEVGVTV